MRLLRNFILPASLMVGTIIGAGIFSLPYVVSKSGILLGIAFLAIISSISIIMHLMYADIIVRTPDHHNRFPGYAKTYLGERYTLWANIIIFTTLLLTLTAYLALSVSFVELLFPGIPLFWRVFVFWFLGSLTIFLNIKRAATFELTTTLLTLGVIAFIFFFGLLGNPTGAFSMTEDANWSNFFLPFGPMIFSILGLTAIPPILVYAREESLTIKNIRQIIIWGTLTPVIFYLLYIIGIMSLSSHVTPDSVSGLIGNVPRYVLIILGIFGFVSLWDSYATLGIDVKKNLEYEHLGFSEATIAIITIFAPLILYLFGVQNFLKLVSVIGGLLISIRAIMMVFIWKKAQCLECDHKILKRLSPITLYFLLVMFGGAIIYQTIKLLS